VPIKLLWFGYLVYTLGNCSMKLCIETGIRGTVASHTKTLNYISMPADIGDPGSIIEISSLFVGAYAWSLYKHGGNVYCGAGCAT